MKVLKLIVMFLKQPVQDALNGAHSGTYVWLYCVVPECRMVQENNVSSMSCVYSTTLLTSNKISRKMSPIWVLMHLLLSTEEEMT